MANFYKLSPNSLLYPEIKIKKTDKYLSRLLLVEYAGCESELSFISKYLYQSMIFKEVDPKLSLLLEKIAEEETEHFKIIGNIILKLDESPIINLSVPFCNQHEKKIKNNLKKILSENILNENEAYKRYMKIFNLIDDEALADIIRKIANSENKHAKEFEYIYNKIT